MSELLSLKPMKQILIFRPPYRRGEIYFRAQQAQRILQGQGYPVRVIAGQGWRSYLWALLRWPFFLWRSQIVLLYPHFLLGFYVLTAFLLRRTVVIDHYVSYIRLKEARWWGIFAWPFEKMTYRRANFILAHTASVAEELRQSWGLCDGRVHTLYSVVDIAHFSPRYHQQAQQMRLKLGLEGQFVVFYHGMWHTWHGVDILRAAVRQLAQAGEPVALVLLGRAGRGLPHERWLDSVPYLELPAYIQLADVWCSGFVNLQRGDRSFSSTMIQALAMARPVITSPSPEKTRYLQPDVSAVFVPPDDPDALSQAILECMHNPRRLRALGRAGRQVVTDHFDQQEFAKFLRHVCETHANHSHRSA